MSRKHRGNEIYFHEESNMYKYLSDHVPVPSDKYRKCGHCGKEQTEEGHDGCLGELIGLMNACCGHGDIKQAYVQFLDGTCVRWEDAVTIQNILKKVEYCR